MAYKVVMTFPDGEVIDSYKEDGDDGIFDTEQEAEDYYTEWISNYSTGGEVLHLSNPGDYPIDENEEDPDYEIVEI
ncbi:MAG: hypothetical protein NC092_10160 [Butyrivibrio sp.]|nr:hypothetical protein [Muribaculum sp.]MCM1553042.1 hypothetical protein [Butyrivibrio sp.]